jgi:hypothetical protein
MTDNLALWNAVERTDPKHTKPITGKSYQGNSPKPHWIIRKATETFGPCGIGWGFTVDERVEDGAMIAPGFYEKLHVAKVTVWYEWNGKRGQVEHIGGTTLSGQRSSGKPYTDEDAPKKSVTDALIKALSMVGFAGDIFLGRYDDSRYVSEVRQEFQQERAAPARQEPPARQAPAAGVGQPEAVRDRLIETLRKATSPDDLAERANRDEEHFQALPSAMQAEVVKVYQFVEAALS